MKNNDKLRFLVREPPPCICGHSEYEITFSEKFIRARCKECRYDRYFNAYSGKWGPKK